MLKHRHAANDNIVNTEFVQLLCYFFQSVLDLALALPDGFTRYLNLAPKTDWLRRTMPFGIYWVGQDKAVRYE